MARLHVVIVPLCAGLHLASAARSQTRAAGREDTDAGVPGAGVDLGALGAEAAVGVDVCDPRTASFRVGGNYSIRSFGEKFEKVGRWIKRVGLPHLLHRFHLGHQYIQIEARDRRKRRCIYSMGLWGKGGEVGIQSPDWSVAIHTKKINTCLGEQPDLERCVEIQKDLMGKPLILAPHRKPARVVAQGAAVYSGRLDANHVALLEAIVHRQRPTPHTFFGGPVLMMDISAQCKFRQLSANIIKAVKKYAEGMNVYPKEDDQWFCNCMTFANRFRFDTEFLLEKIRLVPSAT